MFLLGVDNRQLLGRGVHAAKNIIVWKLVFVEKYLDSEASLLFCQTAYIKKKKSIGLQKIVSKEYLH